MPVSHIGLTVSHLPTSCSFFLSALQPLGYRYIGQQGNQIGLGIHDADFFLCQETPGMRAGAAHIAFTAASRVAVRDFYAAALTAGGRPNGAPASRSDEDGHFNAAILDLDGNSIEVVYQNKPDVREDGTVVEHSRVITWRRTVSESYHDDSSVVSGRSSRLAARSTVDPAPPASIAPSALSKAPSTASRAMSVMRSVSEPVMVPKVASVATGTDDAGAKKLIGTLIGAAAGAAVAYAMVSSERDSAKKEINFAALHDAKNTVIRGAQLLAQVLPDNQPLPPAQQHPQLTMQDPQAIFELSSQASDATNGGAGPPHALPQGSVYAPRALEAAPASYHAASVYNAVPPSKAGGALAIEYAPTCSIAPPRTHFSAHRSMTDPQLLTVAKARSNVSKVHSVAPSTLISSFVPEHVPRRSSEGSVASHRSSKSRSKSHVSKHSSHSRHASRAPSPSAAGSITPGKSATKIGSVAGSILGRDAGSSASHHHSHFLDAFEMQDVGGHDSSFDDDADTVAPSDSISNAGSSSRRRRHRSSRTHSYDDDRNDEHEAARSSTGSKHSHSHSHGHHTPPSAVSASSKRSKSKSRHSSSSSASSHRSSRHHPTEEAPHSPSPLSSHASYRLPTILSEPSETSTIKPYKQRSGAGSSASKSSRASKSRKDSLVQGQEDGSGEEVALPVRGKSMMRWDMGQRMRAFEG